MAHNLNEKERTEDVILSENVSFDTLLLPEPLMSGLRQNGFIQPSPIQLKAIPIGRCGFDLIVKAKSGTGKTLVFTVLGLEMIDLTLNAVQMLVLAPTREIAVQIQSVIQAIGVCYEGLKVESFIGGIPIEKDIEKLKTCHIAVGAPGRVKHLIETKQLKTDSVKLFVLDEADKLMENTFCSDINDIYSALPERKQMIVASATYTDELDKFLASYMHSPTHISSSKDIPLLLGLKQFVATVKFKNNAAQEMKAKNSRLIQLLSKISFTQCLVFTNYQTRAESVSNYLNQMGWNSTYISAAQNQTQRLEAYSALKEFKCRILLSTDLTARGIDVANVDVVINYDVPKDAVVYLHRMGRAGRYGSKGICINIAGVGRELKDLQVVLGKIGGVNLGVCKLELDEKFPNDVWNCDEDSLEKIYGVIQNDDNDEGNIDIKDSVMKIKGSNEAKKKSNKKNNTNVNQKSDTNELEQIKNFLNETHKEAETTENVDLEGLLKSMANGEDINLNINDSKQTSLNLNLTSESTSSSIIPDSKTKTAVRSLALLNVCKVTVDEQPESIDVAKESIKNYLLLLKNEKDCKDLSEQLHDKSATEILTNLDSYKNQVEHTKQASNDDNLEKIFDLGYNYACGKSTEHWLSHFIDKTQNDFQDFCNKSTQVESNSEEDEEEVEEMEYMEEEYAEVETGKETVNESYEDQLNPAAEKMYDCGDANFTHKQMCEPTSEYDQYYSRYFDECSNMLAYNADNFDNMASFDEWFVHWQQYLQDVRIYVQQNIYVNELSRYQQMKWNSK